MKSLESTYQESATTMDSLSKLRTWRFWAAAMSVLGIVAGAAVDAQAQTVPAGYSLSVYRWGLPYVHQMIMNKSTGTVYFARAEGGPDPLYATTSGGYTTLAPDLSPLFPNSSPYTDIKYHSGAVYAALSIGGNGPANLVKIDVSTGDATVVPTHPYGTNISGVGGLAGLAFTGSSTLFISDGDGLAANVLQQFDVGTSPAMLVNTAVNGSASITTLQYDPIQNQLYGINQNDGQLTLLRYNVTEAWRLLRRISG